MLSPLFGIEALAHQPSVRLGDREAAVTRERTEDERQPLVAGTAFAAPAQPPATKPTDRAA
jgi:hypothetical protein